MKQNCFSSALLQPLKDTQNKLKALKSGAKRFEEEAYRWTYGGMQEKDVKIFIFHRYYGKLTKNQVGRITYTSDFCQHSVLK